MQDLVLINGKIFFIHATFTSELSMSLISEYHGPKSNFFFWSSKCQKFLKSYHIKMSRFLTASTFRNHIWSRFFVFSDKDCGSRHLRAKNVLSKLTFPRISEVPRFLEKNRSFDNRGGPGSTFSGVGSGRVLTFGYRVGSGFS